MTGADIGRMVLLAALWGGSFIYIRVISPVLGPVMTIESRLVIAGIALVAYAAVIKAPLEISARRWQYAVIGALNFAVPFVLISYTELHLSASLVAILIAASPLFGAVVAAIWLREPLTPAKLIGIAVAIAGVTILVGWTPLKYNLTTWLSIAGSLLAAAFYGLAGVYMRVKAQGAPPLGVAAGSLVIGAAMLAPAAPFAWPHHAPTAIVAACVAGLALLSTSLAYVIYFRLVADIGAARALTVTFLAPIFAVAWGALFLREPVTIAKLGACAIILVGTGLVTGFRLRDPQPR